MKREKKREGARLLHFELSEKNIKLRWIIVGVLLVIATVALTWGIRYERQRAEEKSVEPGWYAVESSSAGLHCGHDFVFHYEYGTGTKKPYKENKELTKLYTKLTENAWKLFYNEAGATSLAGLYQVNSHPNQEVSVDPALYDAFRMLEEQGSRLHYLGPVYAVYDQVFLNGDELIAASWDPGQDAENSAYVQEIARFAAEPDAIRLELRPDYKVFLHVSEEYAAYLEENVAENCYLDFGWLRNAFVVDYMAQKLEEKGFTNGSITSLDGFTRNLDRRGTGYRLNIFNRRNGETEQAASMERNEPSSMVYLRTYDSSRALSFSNGRVVTYMVDGTDGQCKAAMPNLVGYSGELSCAEIALRLAPYYIADSFSADGVRSLATEGCYCIWFEGTQLLYTQQDLQLVLQNEAYTLAAPTSEE